jgi:hypothetical protein
LGVNALYKKTNFLENDYGLSDKHENQCIGLGGSTQANGNHFQQSG